MNQEGLYLEFDEAVTYISCIGLLIHTKELNCSIFCNSYKNRKGLLWISFFYVEQMSILYLDFFCLSNRLIRTDQLYLFLSQRNRKGLLLIYIFNSEQMKMICNEPIDKPNRLV